MPICLYLLTALSLQLAHLSSIVIIGMDGATDDAFYSGLLFLVRFLSVIT